MKAGKYISWFLGVSMFLFGALKFVDPFKSWYTIQISHSGQGAIAYALGIIGEIITGAIIIIALTSQKRINTKMFRLALTGTSFTIAIIMSMAIYVHLDPNVPAEVLPLKIKFPIIPGIFLTSALINTFLVLKYKQETQTLAR